jgi:hypothetical protein
VDRTEGIVKDEDPLIGFMFVQEAGTYVMQPDIQIQDFIRTVFPGDGLSLDCPGG